jgi:hypothetical protein
LRIIIPEVLWLINCRRKKASFTLENLERAKATYLLPGCVRECTLLTDDDSENYGEVKQ